MFYLPKPRPLDHLVGTLFAGPTLVLNGALDPLQKAVDRAEVTGCLSVPSLCLTLLSFLAQREHK